MEKYNVIFHKPTQQYEVRLFLKQSVGTESRIEKFLNIINLFNVQEMIFVGTCISRKNDSIMDDLQTLDTNFSFNRRKAYNDKLLEINIEFTGERIEEIIKLTEKTNLPLYVSQSKNSTKFSGFEVLVNDREYWSITFQKDIIDYDDFINKLETILN
ncbi:MAG: hypothetical protein WC351_02520 [Candidatus Izemoplasmatales bacterium]|jgi:purine-nucleoside phosphorylase